MLNWEYDTEHNISASDSVVYISDEMESILIDLKNNCNTNKNENYLLVLSFRETSLLSILLTLKNITVN